MFNKDCPTCQALGYVCPNHREDTKFPRDDDECECGDYRSEHDLGGAGPCKVHGCRTGLTPCNKFVFAGRRREIKTWRDLEVETDAGT